jgi:phosphatidate cytidylyltransferase
MGRVFGRSRDAEPAAEEIQDRAEPVAERRGAEYDPRLSSSPDELAVFSAVSGRDDELAAETADAAPADDTVAAESSPPVADALEPGEADDEPEVEPGEADDEPEPEPGEADDEPEEADHPEPDGLAPVTEMPAPATATQESFAALWGASGEDLDDDPNAEDIIDFAAFTSEDYLQATTSEYAGLAADVARAEEEGTQRIAVSAEIPGLESGLVGLDDVVTAAGESASEDLIEPPRTSDLSIRVLTAIGLLILFGASLLSPYGIGALIVVVLGIAAGEMFAALIRGGYRPLSIFGFAGIAGAFFGTWAAGPVAIPISLLLTAIGVFLFYATVPGRRAVLENATATLLVTAWIGGLGGLAFDLLGSEHYRWMVLSLVITVAVMDVGQYFVGRRLGKHKLAPRVSPKKTIEGYIAGLVVAVGVGAAFAWAEPFDLVDGLVIGGVVAVVAPFGDLAVSVIKRALGVKDMGYILPGHGGVLDRVDAMIMTIPALWIAFSWMGLLS